jgi:hypothetical protein
LAGCFFLLAAPVFGLPASSCTPTFTLSDVYEDGNILQLPALAIAGDVVLLDAPSAISDVFRVFNNIIDTGGGTGLAIRLSSLVPMRAIFQAFFLSTQRSFLRAPSPQVALCKPTSSPTERHITFSAVSRLQHQNRPRSHF